MDENTELLEAISERLAKLEEKVAALEGRFAVRGASPVSRNPQTETSVVLDEMRRMPPVPQRTPPEPLDWERVGRVWLPIVFIVAILVGVAFAFDAAIKAGLINQQARIVIGYVGSAALLFAGEWQLRRERRTLGDVLVGAAVGVMLLTTFAGNHLYGILGTPYAVGLGVVFTAAGAYLANRHNSQTLAVIATIAGFLTSLMLTSQPPAPVFIAVYALVMSTGFVLYALSRNFQGVFYLAWFMLHFTLIVTALSQAHVYPIYAMVALAQHLGVMTYLFIKRTPLSERYWLFYPSLAATALWSMGLTRSQGRIEFLALGVVYLAVLLYQRMHREIQHEVLPVYVIGTVYSFAFFLLFAFRGENLVLALVIESALGLSVGLVLKFGTQIWTSSLLYYVSLIAVLFVSPAGTRVYGLFGKFIGEDFTIDLIATLSTLVIAYLAHRQKLASEGADRAAAFTFRVFRWAAPVAFLLFFSNALLTVLQSLSSDDKMLSVSFLWALMAVAFIIYGVARDNRQGRAMGIMLLFVTLLKLVVVDLPFVSVVLRAVLFIGVGSIGVFASRLFYRKK